MADLYFAYGSNLDPEDWSRFCAAYGYEPRVLTPVGPAALEGEILVFDYRSVRRGCGALNIRPLRAARSTATCSTWPWTAGPRSTPRKAIRSATAERP